MKKTLITEVQRKQFNAMREALIKISKKYQSSRQLQKNCEKEYGLEYTETLEMAYENIQNEAKNAVKGVKKIANKIAINVNGKDIWFDRESINYIDIANLAGFDFREFYTVTVSVPKGDNFTVSPSNPARLYDIKAGTIINAIKTTN
jgi:hypothetical protein